MRVGTKSCRRPSTTRGGLGSGLQRTVPTCAHAAALLTPPIRIDLLASALVFSPGHRAARSSATTSAASSTCRSAARPAAGRAAELDGVISDAALYAVDGGVVTITPAATTVPALSVELVDAVGDRLQAAQDDDAVRSVVVLTNAGNTFCAGADLKTKSAALRHTLVDILDAIIDSPKPVVGRIAGHSGRSRRAGGGVRHLGRRRRRADRLHRGARRRVPGGDLGGVPAEAAPRRRERALPHGRARADATRARPSASSTARCPATASTPPSPSSSPSSCAEAAALAASKELVARAAADAGATPSRKGGAALAETLPLRRGEGGIAAFKEKRDAAWVTGG